MKSLFKVSHTNKPEERNSSKSDGVFFKNVCIGIWAIGKMVLSFWQFFS